MNEDTACAIIFIAFVLFMAWVLKRGRKP